MDSSFLTGIHISLGLFACILFLKLVIQFGIPNHPARFVSYSVGLCAAAYFSGFALTDLGLITKEEWIRWRSLPLIAGSLCLLLQTFMLSGNFSLFQQKVISRLPLIMALLGFSFFPTYADAVVIGLLSLGGVFLIVSVKNARYQKRIYLKMLLLFLIYLSLNAYGTVVLFFMMFYLFLFEQSFALAALVDDFKESLQGDLK